MKLIIESGATKTECCLLDDAGKVCFRFRVAGINVAVTPPEAVSAAVEDAASHMPGDVPGCREIVFYGAGIMEPAVDSVQGKEVAAECLPAGLRHLDMCLHKAFPDAAVEYHSDLLAAARGLCGPHPGIVAILGTGSNSCQYDGVRIVRNIRPGGFILGDEGGGEPGAAHLLESTRTAAALPQSALIAACGWFYLCLLSACSTMAATIFSVFSARFRNITHL